MPRHTTIGRIPHGDDPLAYLLTWTTYGTWLPGDERGWVEKPGQFREPDIERQLQALMRMTEPAIVLDDKQRAIVEAVIRKHCEIRKWTLHAVQCRTNHVHVVVTADRPPDVVLDQLKSWCTRLLKEDQRTRHPEQPMRDSWWTQRGSKQSINDEDGLARANSYVLEGQ
ncbi:MAG: transposase [Planctomycetales bacterium]|nr:transposase [Planctomycetales bacterium]